MDAPNAEHSPRDESIFQAVLADVRSTILVADVGEVVGFVHVVLRESPAFPVFVPQPRGLVENVCVASEWRRHGVAKSLMQAAEKWAQDGGAQGMDLSVYEFNDGARALFSAMGYSTLSRRMSKHGSH